MCTDIYSVFPSLRYPPLLSHSVKIFSTREEIERMSSFAARPRASLVSGLTLTPSDGNFLILQFPTAIDVVAIVGIITTQCKQRKRKMLRVSVKIQGISPYIPHRFTDEAGQAASNGNRVISNLGSDTPLERATKFLYTDKDGKPVITQPAVFGSIVSAGRFFKLGKNKMTTQQTSLVPAYLNVTGAYFHITHKEPWTVDTRPVRIPATGGRILEHRPLFNDWQISFEVEAYSGIDESLTRSLVDAAGLRIGIGDMRPEKKGPFGRFKVIQWKCDKLDDIDAGEIDIEE